MDSKIPKELNHPNSSTNVPCDIHALTFKAQFNSKEFHPRLLQSNDDRYQGAEPRSTSMRMDWGLERSADFGSDEGALDLTTGSSWFKYSKMRTTSFSQGYRSINSLMRYDHMEEHDYNILKHFEEIYSRSSQLQSNRVENVSSIPTVLDIYRSILSREECENNLRSEQSVNHDAKNSSVFAHDYGVVKPKVYYEELTRTLSPFKFPFGQQNEVERYSPPLNFSAFAMDQNMICPICRKCFRFEKNLLRHLQKTHATGTGESVLKCKLCNYTTRHYSNMYVHIRTHTGDKPYTCSACGVSFTQGSSLKLHIKSRHHDNASYFTLTRKPGKNNLTKLWTRVLKKDLPKYNALVPHMKYTRCGKPSNFINKEQRSTFDSVRFNLLNKVLKLCTLTQSNPILTPNGFDDQISACAVKSQEKRRETWINFEPEVKQTFAPISNPFVACSTTGIFKLDEQQTGRSKYTSCKRKPDSDRPNNIPSDLIPIKLESNDHVKSLLPFSIEAINPHTNNHDQIKNESV